MSCRKVGARAEKPIDELNLAAEFVQLVTLLYSDGQKSSLASTTAQILTVKDLPFRTPTTRESRRPVFKLERSQTNGMPEAQAAAVTQVIKQLRGYTSEGPPMLS